MTSLIMVGYFVIGETIRWQGENSKMGLDGR
jgi:hypothetical protein